MYTNIIFVLTTICIIMLLLLTSSLYSRKYKEGQCIKENTPPAALLKTRTNVINKRISEQTDNLTSISARVNEILLKYSNFKFSISGVGIDTDSKKAQVNIDRNEGTTVSNPRFLFTLISSPTGDVGDPGNQGITGIQGQKGMSAASGLPGYWGNRGGCYT